MINPKTKERELAYIVKIDEIRPIDGYDRVEHARVGGWWIIVQKNQFKVGDYAVYFEIDSKAPNKPEFEFLAKRNFKIKTLKMCKTISQGLLMHLSDFTDGAGKIPTWLASFNCTVTSMKIANTPQERIDEYALSTFLTKDIGVTYADAEDNTRKANSLDKYAKMKQRHNELFKKPFFKFLYSYTIGKKILFLFLGKKKDSRGGWPVWVTKTDEERCQNMPYLFPGDPDEKWYATEKIDGTSTTFTMKKGLFQNEYLVCSRNVAFNTPEKAEKCFYEDNVYLEMSKKYNIESKLRYILENNNELNFVTLQGETYGKSVQKREYGLDGHDFMAFNLIFGYKDGHKERLNPQIMTDFLSKYDIPCVPIIDDAFIIPTTCDELLNIATGSSKIDGGMREGLVFRSIDGVKSFKAVSNEFLIKYHDN